ncbi:hypothetical protein THIOM_000838 [Candidatus Thiomargarita nelsonii]|uniref:Uncharacterized protein n=1 Tax=Candidatus Thiomargarita nelsonii TaxID=1003181 RepID=A0A176S5I9_9GAMM|nr:hypothetical protein THIOM_000838 [Candidatus Thiomargarita nelsonii]
MSWSGLTGSRRGRRLKRPLQLPLKLRIKSHRLTPRQAIETNCDVTSPRHYGLTGSRRGRQLKLYQVRRF